MKDEIIKQAKRYHDKHVRKCIDLGRDPQGKSDHKYDPMKTSIAGSTYWPKNMEWPSINNIPLLNIFQINFAEMPKLDGFPTNGMLQIFVDNEIDWFNNPKAHMKCVYHENISVDQLADNIPDRSDDNFYRDYYDTDAWYDFINYSWSLDTPKIEDSYPSGYTVASALTPDLASKYGKQYEYDIMNTIESAIDNVSGLASADGRCWKETKVIRSVKMMP